MELSIGFKSAQSKRMSSASLCFPLAGLGKCGMVRLSRLTLHFVEKFRTGLCSA